ncbi:MAG: pullulanase, partial [Mycolicibacterium sp.]|nr:pullulanase [Mycolicibacterium sp.]
TAYADRDGDGSWDVQFTDADSDGAADSATDLK